MYFFTPPALMGTVAIVVGLTVLVMKTCEGGKAFLAEKFGKNWESKLIIRFLGIPAIVVGLLMFLPDHFWIDALKLAAFFVAFIFWSIWKDKQKAKQHKAATGSETGEAAAS